MSPPRRVGLRALVLGIAVLWACPVGAQLYEDARRAIDLSPDPLARSPRLLGMGRLSLVIDDPRNRITLWDFAANPTGIGEVDTVSTLEVRPSTASASGIERGVPPAPRSERQFLAAREVRMTYEAWRRTHEGTAYGASGEVGSLRLDRPFSTDVEERSKFAQPTVVPVLTGRMPYVLTERMRYALRIIAAYETSSDRYREFVSNAAGQYADQDGITIGPPDFFTPDEYATRKLGSGAAVSYRFGPSLTAAVGADYLGTRIQGKNNGGRYGSETEEARPYGIGQATLIGRFGPHFEWGADGHGWKSSSETRWVFSISSGPAATPLAGRGHLLDRDEEGSSLRTRARWTLGSFELGAGYNTEYRKIEITAPDAGDLTSFNYFRNVVVHHPNADSLALPDSVVSNASEERGVEVGGGAAWKLPHRKGAVGVEYHWDRRLFEQTLGGRGPRPGGWDVRGGVWYPLTQVLEVRGGYLYRREDHDELTKQNEFVSSTMTLGAGLVPVGTRWSFDTGYALEWSHADFGDPGLPHSNRQRLAVRVGWAF